MNPKHRQTITVSPSAERLHRRERSVDFRDYTVEASISRRLDDLPEDVARSRFSAEREGLGPWDFIGIETEAGKVLIGQARIAGHGAVVWCQNALSWRDIRSLMESIYGSEVLVMNPDTGAIS